MQGDLARTGTASLLEQISAFVPDDFINELMPRHRGRGRRAQWKASQMYRLLLLSVLTPAHSSNLLVKLLKEQRAWRKFCFFSHRLRVPVASQLHDFRETLGVIGLRRINEHMLQPLLDSFPADRLAIGLIDATDLPAATSAFKKSLPGSIRHVVQP